MSDVAVEELRAWWLAGPMSPCGIVCEGLRGAEMLGWEGNPGFFFHAYAWAGGSGEARSWGGRKGGLTEDGCFE